VTEGRGQLAVFPGGVRKYKSLLAAPLSRLALEEGVLDAAVELVDVHGVEPVLK